MGNFSGLDRPFEHLRLVAYFRRASDILEFLFATTPGEIATPRIPQGAPSAAS
jgi:hypothetical protein